MGVFDNSILTLRSNSHHALETCTVMIEKPKPLLLGLGLEPKQTLKAMLEATDRKDNGKDPYPSPLSEVDPMTLDELMNRIDSGSLALGQVPDPKDRAQLVSYYWSERDKFALEQQLGITIKPKRKSSQSVSTLTVSVADVLGEIDPA